MAFTLKRDSRLARWAFWFEIEKSYESHWDNATNSYITTYLGKVPAQTSLCNLFWRVFLWAPLCVIVPVGLVGGLLFAIGLFFFQQPKAAFSLDGFFLIIGLFIWWLQLSKHKGHQSLTTAFKDTLLYQGVKAVKSKFCPIIKFS